MLEPPDSSEWSAEVCALLNENQLREPAPGSAAMCVSALPVGSQWSLRMLGLWSVLLLCVGQDRTGGEERSLTWTWNSRLGVWLEGFGQWDLGLCH